MDFAPTEEQRLVQRTARDVAERLLLPRAAARDLSGEFPTTELQELAGERFGIKPGTVARWLWSAWGRRLIAEFDEHYGRFGVTEAGFRFASRFARPS